MDYSFCYGKVDSQNHQNDILQDIFSLRYQVYVNEWAFEEPQDHPGGLEFDEYDRSSVHFYARSNQDNTVVGTARIILDSELGFPIEKHFTIESPPQGVVKNQIGEISRLAVSKDYRRRAIDRAIFGRGGYDPAHIPRYADEGRDVRRHCEHELIRGLYLSIYRESKQRSLTHWYAVMARGLYIILKRWGIFFHQVGPEKNFHGLRAPYLVSIESIEETLARDNPDLLNEARECTIH